MAWLTVALDTVAVNYDLAVEIIKCRRLVKGYSDTHSRTQSKFDRVVAVATQLGERGDAADQIRRLCEAALRDEDGTSLDDALQALDGLYAPPVVS